MAAHAPAPSPITPPTVVLGVGNILLRDEGIGVRVVEAVEQRGCPEGVELIDGATAGLDLLDLIADRHKVIIVDALDAELEPATVVRLRPDELAATPEAGVSLHDLGVLELLAVAEKLDCAPQQVVILGVQPKRVEVGLELTPELSSAIPGIVDAVLEELAR